MTQRHTSPRRLVKDNLSKTTDRYLLKSTHENDMQIYFYSTPKKKEFNVGVQALGIACLLSLLTAAFTRFVQKLFYCLPQDNPHSLSDQWSNTHTHRYIVLVAYFGVSVQSCVVLVLKWSLVQNAIFCARCVRQNESSHYCLDVRPSVCLSGTGVHCDYTVHFSADLTFLDNPTFWATLHQSMSTYSQPSFSSSTWKRGVVWMCKLGEELNANNGK